MNTNMDKTSCEESPGICEQKRYSSLTFFIESHRAHTPPVREIKPMRHISKLSFMLKTCTQNNFFPLSYVSSDGLETFGADLISWAANF